MFRFFADTEEISDKLITLNYDDSKHIKTLRLRPDERFIVCDGKGTDYICVLGERDGDLSAANIISSQPSSGEPDISCKVYIGVMKSDRLEYAVQKSVELGATDIILYESARCDCVPKDIDKKTVRLTKISLEAAKLCGRGIIPGVYSCGKFDIMLNHAISSSDLTLLFYESEEQLHIKSILEQNISLKSDKPNDRISSISLITGPVGGFDPHEIEQAAAKKIPIVSLGPRILRAETAPVVALTAIMYQTGNL